MEIKDSRYWIIIIAIAFASCNSLDDCERNFIEGTGLTERAYLAIQDNDKLLKASEVEELLAAMPLGNVDIRERRSIIGYASRVFNECVKASSSAFELNKAGCYSGEVIITDKNYKKAEDKFSIGEYAKAIKEKYPRYEGYEDIDIVNAFVEKFPDLKSQIDFDDKGSTNTTLEIPPVKLEDGSFKYSPKNSREVLINQFRQTTGLSEKDVPDGVIAYSAAEIYPELKDALGVRTEGYEVDWGEAAKNKTENRTAPKATESAEQVLQLQKYIKVDFDLRGYYIEYNEEKKYFNEDGVIALSFTDSLPSWRNLNAKIQIIYKLEKNHLLYEQIISTYRNNTLSSTKTTSGTLSRVSSSIEECK